MKQRQKPVTAAEKNNVYLDKDAARDSVSAKEREREIKRGASGCQVDQNKHWVPCRQRACFSQTDTKLDPPLSSSKQHNTDTTSSVNLDCVCLKRMLSFYPSLVPDCKLLLSSLISSYPSSFICFFLLTPSFFCLAFIPLIPSLCCPSVHPHHLPLIVLPSSPISLIYY